MTTTQSTPAFTFQMTVPQQTQFSPLAAVNQNSAKSVATKAKAQTTLTSSARHSEQTTTLSTPTTPSPDLPTKHKIPSHTTPIPGPSVQTNGYYESENSDTEQSAERRNKFNAYHLVDITPAKPKHHLAPGRPKKGTLDLFLQKCFRESQPGKHLHRCIGVGCNVTFLNRNLQRTIKHARICNKLPKNLRTKAKQLAANNALSKKLLGSESEQTDNERDKVTVHEGVQAAQQVDTTKKTEDGRLVPTHKWFEEARTLGKDERHKRLDFAILLLICAAGLPTYIVSRPEWRRMLMVADPTYTPAMREKLETEQIVSEAENVMAKQLEYLRTQENLTISCDGGTTKGREAFWTVHVSTPKRKVYLMEVREAISESHTGVWIKNLVLEVRHYYINASDRPPLTLLDRQLTPLVGQESVQLFATALATRVSLDNFSLMWYPKS